MTEPAGDGRVRAPIDAGLGYVEVSNVGVPTAVEINEEVMRTTRAEDLAEHLVAAIASARNLAAGQRVAAMRRFRENRKR